MPNDLLDRSSQVRDFGLLDRPLLNSSIVSDFTRSTNPFDIPQFSLSQSSFSSSTAGLDDALETAPSVALSPNVTTVSDFVGTTDPNDFFRFDMSAPSNFDLRLRGLRANLDVQLLNQQGDIIASSDRLATRRETISLNLGTGTYFVRVFPGADSANSSYRLDLALDPLQLIAATDDNRLIAFNPDRPGRAFEIGTITGLAEGDQLVKFDAIDFRPASGNLFALGQSSQLYTIDINTAVATPFGHPFSPGLNSDFVGIDFNPVPDRLRVVGSSTQNFRLNPDEIARTVTVVDFDPNTPGLQTDPNLSFDGGDLSTGRSPDVNAGIVPNIVATAYRNNRTDAATTPERTTQFGIDSELDILVQQGSPTGSPISPNSGRLFTIGELGFDFGADTAFDITTDASRRDTAFATSNSRLYTIDLNTGAATRLGTVRVDGYRVGITGLSARML
jgi:hypothetical protein